MMRGRFTWLSFELVRMYLEEMCVVGYGEMMNDLQVNLAFEQSLCCDAGVGAALNLPSRWNLALYCFDIQDTTSISDIFPPILIL